MSPTALLLAAVLCFVIANVIHNGGGVDPAIAPATLLAALYVWRRHRVLLWLALLAIAVPSFAFLKFGALGDPAALRPFLNHLALLLAGTLAVLSALRDLLGRSRRRPR